MDLSFFKRKELGLPVWAWGLIVGVIVFILYRHYRNGASAASSPLDTAGASAGTTGTPSDFGGGSGSGGGSLGGGSPDAGGANDVSGALNSLATALAPESAYYQSLLDAGQSPTDPTAPGDTNTTPTPTIDSAKLSWDSTSFTTRAQFNAYLKSKGLSVKQFAARHPAAYGIYLSLPAGATKTKQAKSSVLHKVTGAIRGGTSGTIHYKTRRKDVHVSAGQTVGFSKGKGYYATLARPAGSRANTRPVTRQPIQPRYFTYRTQVHMGNNEKLHYRRGRGYYAR